MFSSLESYAWSSAESKPYSANWCQVDPILEVTSCTSSLLSAFSRFTCSLIGWSISSLSAQERPSVANKLYYVTYQISMYVWRNCRAYCSMQVLEIMIFMCKDMNAQDTGCRKDYTRELTRKARRMKVLKPACLWLSECSWFPSVLDAMTPTHPWNRFQRIAEYNTELQMLLGSESLSTSGTQAYDQSADKWNGVSNRSAYLECRWAMLRPLVSTDLANGIGFSTCRK